MATNVGQVVVNGRCLSGNELRDYAKRNGLCPICGLFQTHKRVGNFLNSRMEPLTKTHEETGVITVYKGYCIQPTCYTSVDQVKKILGERPSRRVSASSQFPAAAPSNHTPHQPPSFGNHHEFTTGSGSNHGNDNLYSDTGYDEIPQRPFVPASSNHRRPHNMNAPHRQTPNNASLSNSQHRRQVPNDYNMSGSQHRTNNNNNPRTGAHARAKKQSTEERMALLSSKKHPAKSNVRKPWQPSEVFQTAASRGPPDDDDAQECSRRGRADPKEISFQVGFHQPENPSRAHSKLTEEYERNMRSMGDYFEDSDIAVNLNTSADLGGGNNSLNNASNGSYPSVAPNPPQHQQHYQQSYQHQQYELHGRRGEQSYVSPQSHGSTYPPQSVSHHISHQPGPPQQQPYEINSVRGDPRKASMPLSPRTNTKPSMATRPKPALIRDDSYKTEATGSTGAGDGDHLSVNSKSDKGDFDHLTKVQKRQSRCPYSNPALEEMYALINDGDYIAFLNKLDAAGPDPELTTECNKLFTQYVVRDQLARPNGVVLGGDGWVKTIKGKVDSLQGDRDVALQTLVTFLSLSTLPGNHQKFMVKKGAIDAVMGILNRHAGDDEIEEIACAFFESLSKNEKDGLNAKATRIATVMRKMVEYVNTDTPGRDYALRMFYHLSNHHKKSQSTGKTLFHDVKNIFEEKEMKEVLLNLITRNDLHESTVQAAMCLFYKLSRSGPSNDQSSVDDPSPQWLSENVVNSIIVAMTNCQSSLLVEAGFGILANAALKVNFPNQLAQSVSHTICELIFQSRSEAVDEALTLSGVHAICNLLSHSERRLTMVSNRLVVTTLINAISRFPNNEDIQELGCESISRACCNDLSTKKAFVLEGSIDLVDRAYDIHVTSAGKASLKVKDAALCAMAALSGCPEGAAQIVRTGLIEGFESMVFVETDLDFQSILQSIVRNSNRLSTIDPSIFGESSTGSEGRPNNFQSEVPLDLQLQSANSSEAVEDIVKGLRAWLRETPNMDETRMTPLANGGFECLLETMREFLDSSPMQEESCNLLSEIYYYIPCVGLNEPISSSSGSLVLFLHTSRAIEAIRDAMRVHRGQASVQASACCALTNLLAPLCLKTIDFQSDWIQWVDPCLKDVLDAMAVNEADIDVQKRAITLFWTLSFLCHDHELKRWTRMVLEKVFDSMRRFSSDEELLVVCCDVLTRLRSDQESLECIGNANGMGALLESLNPQNEQVAVYLTAILAWLLKKVFTASGYILHVDGSIRKLIDCMTYHKNNCDIQIHVCSILESLVILEDQRVRLLILDYGGLAALSHALVVHGSDETLVEHACRTLSGVMFAVDDGSLLSVRDSLGDAFTNILRYHINNPMAESAVMDVLYICCERDEYFKSILLDDLQTVDVIILSMKEHLASPAVLQSGCSLLWTMSSYGDGKSIIGERGGIPAVVNAMLAHPDGTALQKEGLSALKNLATISSNKDRISDVGGRDAVMCSLHIHFRDPQVLSGAFAALNNIAVVSETRTVAPLEEDVMRCLIVAMKRFPYDEMLQKNACFLLKSCSYLDDNLRMMGQSGGQLLPLLTHAAETFPEKCRDRAVDVMQKLNEWI